MKESDLKPGDASAMAECFAIFHAALVIAPTGSEMPFKGHKRRTVASVFRQAGLYKDGRLTRRGRRLQQLAIENYEKSIALDPKNENGIKMLKKLREEK